MKRARAYCLGQPGALEQHREEREANGVALARRERAGRRPQPARAACPAVDSSVRWSRTSSGSVTRSRARSPLGQLDVAPQVLEHPNEVRLAAAVEAAHPHRRLLRLAEVGEEAVEDALEPARVLAVADEAAAAPTAARPTAARSRAGRPWRRRRSGSSSRSGPGRRAPGS